MIRRNAIPITALVIGLSVIGVCPCSLALAATPITHYETRDGLIASRIKTFKTAPQETARIPQPFGLDTTLTGAVSLGSGRQVILRNLPDEDQVYMLSDDGTFASKTGGILVKVADYLRSVTVFAYDPVTKSVFLAVRSNGKLEGIVRGVQDDTGDTWILEARDASTLTVDAQLVAIVKEMAESGQPAGRTPRSSSPMSASTPLSDYAKAQMFFRAKNHPGATVDIKRFTILRPASKNVKPQVEQGTFYAGVLKQTSRTTVIVTTWIGDIELKVRREETDSQLPTRIIVAQSPSNQKPMTNVELKKLTGLEPGQFISIYASAKTREIEWLTIFKQADP